MKRKISIEKIGFFIAFNVTTIMLIQKIVTQGLSSLTVIYR